MAKIRTSIDLPDLSAFEPKAKKENIDIAKIEKVAESEGFNTRHGTKKTTSLSGHFDARSLRRSDRTAKLNIAVRPETRERFWNLAQQINLTSGEEVLTTLMDQFEKPK